MDGQLLLDELSELESEAVYASRGREPAFHASANPHGAAQWYLSCVTHRAIRSA